MRTISQRNMKEFKQRVEKVAVKLRSDEACYDTVKALADVAVHNGGETYLCTLRVYVPCAMSSEIGIEPCRIRTMYGEITFFCMVKLLPKTYRRNFMV